MISFYPGPSRVHDEVSLYVSDAQKKGVLSINHRSEAFMDIAKKTVKLLRQKLFVPDDYRIYFTSSATECWEIIAQSLITKKSYHIFNGAFGKKWHEYTKRLHGGARDYPFEAEKELNPSQYRFGSGEGVICLTQNETSNGTQISGKLIQQLRENNPNQLIAVDATSSMGGIALDYKFADIWFASVQKCLGLPAGLGIMICSPRALEHAEKTGERDHYNSLLFIDEMMDKWQTVCTPNVLGIYLLMRTMKDAKPIFEVESKLFQRYTDWLQFFSDHASLNHLIANGQVHSYTVLPISAIPKQIDMIKEKAKSKGILLGEGYGDLKPSTFRIANFPAIKKSEIQTLKKFLSKVD